MVMEFVFVCFRRAFIVNAALFSEQQMEVYLVENLV